MPSVFVIFGVLTTFSILAAGLGIYHFLYCPNLLHSIGAIAGIFGLALYSLTLILPSRLPALEKLLKGLPHLFFVHHALGFFAFELILLHPVLITMHLFVDDPIAAAEFLFPIEGFGLITGWISLLLLMAIFITTVLAKLPYETWRRIHTTSGIVFVVAVVHALWYADTPVILIGYLLIAIPGLGGFTYWEIFRHGRGPRFSYEIDEVRLLAERVFELVLIPSGAHMHFEPGQFIYLSVTSAAPTPGYPQIPLNEPHPFTIASAPAEQKLRLVVKALGDFTTELRRTIHGKVEIEGPYGAFFDDCHTSSVSLTLIG
jgi:predicted ferric reductase